MFYVIRKPRKSDDKGRLKYSYLNRDAFGHWVVTKSIQQAIQFVDELTALKALEDFKRWDYTALKQDGNKRWEVSVLDKNTEMVGLMHSVSLLVYEKLRMISAKYHMDEDKVVADLIKGFKL